LSPSRFVIPSLLLLLVSQACLYDPDQPCGKNQYFQNDECLCAPGMVLNETETGCKPCGQNEFAAGTICVCAKGHVRPSEGAPCEPAGEALGRECDPATNPCADSIFSHCAVPSSGTGYCTNTGCSSNDECAGGYGCQARTSPSFCERLPTGLGQPCSSSDQCAGFEANYCETYRSKTCLVSGCAAREISCYGGSVCCDWGALGVNLSLCVRNESLEEGNCPLNGMIVQE
jgi:hypothetical protein